MAQAAGRAGAFSGEVERHDPAKYGQADGLPNDARLPGTGPLQDPRQLSAFIETLLPQWLGYEARLADCRPAVRRYVPGKRCVFELELTVRREADAEPERLALIGKLYRREGAGSVYETLEQLSERGFASGPYRVPQALAYHPEWELVLQSRANGTRLSDELLKGAQNLEAVDASALWLAKFHNSDLQMGRRYTFERQIHTLTLWQKNIAQVSREHAHIFGQVVEALQGRARPWAEAAAGPTHRDFTPEHVIVDGAVTTVLDFDEFSLYDPLFDVAHFVARLKFVGLLHFHSLDYFDGLASRFVESYRAAAHDYSKEQLDLYQAVSFLKLVHITITVTRPPRWQQIASALLDQAQCLAASD